MNVNDCDAGVHLSYALLEDAGFVRSFRRPDLVSEPEILDLKRLLVAHHHFKSYLQPDVWCR